MDGERRRNLLKDSSDTSRLEGMHLFRYVAAGNNRRKQAGEQAETGGGELKCYVPSLIRTHHVISQRING